MFKLEEIGKLFGANAQSIAFTQELMEYQEAKTKMDALQACLEELCSAIEDFKLCNAADLAQDAREIYCREKTYTPLALVEQAHQTAEQLEIASEVMEEAKNRVLTKILDGTENAGQYQAIRYAVIDLPACIRGEQAIPDYVYL
ncbi:MAG: hypothetical protein R3Y06_01490 [Faecalibacterium sp.]